MQLITAQVLPDTQATDKKATDANAASGQSISDRTLASPGCTSAEPPVLRRMWMGNSDLIAAIWLAGSLVCLALAGTMSIGDDRRVYLPGLAEPLPELCWMYKNLRVDCPGCGLTRTFIHMAHGRPVAALGTNLIGVLIFLFACMHVPMGISQVVFRQRGPWIEKWGFVCDWCVAGLLLALLVQWGVKLVV